MHKIYTNEMPVIDGCPICNCLQHNYTVEEQEMRYQGSLFITHIVIKQECYNPDCKIFAKHLYDEAIEKYGKFELTFKPKVDINDKIEEWHTSEGHKTLHDFLGMTWSEYAHWVETLELPPHLRSVYSN